VDLDSPVRPGVHREEVSGREGGLPYLAVASVLVPVVLPAPPLVVDDAQARPGERRERDEHGQAHESPQA
jgi:hypothetical protein